jgi:hypothetical protein
MLGWRHSHLSMNPPITSDNQESVQLEKLRAQLSTDIEAMQQKEASLREYEQRLRLLVDHAQQGQSTQPTAQYYVTSENSQAALDAEWEKHSRAHALLEAARRGLTDDRLALRDREEKLAQREVEVARREAWVKAREQELAAAVATKPVAPQPKPTFASDPLLVARNLFMPRKG